MKVKIAYLTTDNEVNELDLVVATISKGEFIIGRSPDCDLPLDSPDVSRIHGKFLVQGGKYYYCDSGSRNGSIVNDQLAVKNQPYILKHGDSIQIGDYFLKIEDITPAAEQLPETVFRVIDPALFSRPISPEINVPNIHEPVPEVVTNLTEEVISPTQEEMAISAVNDVAAVQQQEVITAPEGQIVSESPILEERNLVQPEDIVNPGSEIAPEVTKNESNEDVDLSTPIVEERTLVQPEDIVNPASEIAPEVTKTESNEDIDSSTSILQEFTIVQPRDTNIQTVLTESDEDVDLSTPITQEFTIVQPRDINIEPASTEGDIKVEDLDIDDGGVGKENLAVESEVQPALEVVSDVDVQATEAVLETLKETDVIFAPPDNILPQAEVTEIIGSEDSDEDVDMSGTTLEEVNQQLTEIEVLSTTENLEILTTETAISTTAVSEEIIGADVVSTAETLETPEIEASISTTAVSEDLVIVGEKLETVTETDEVPDVDNVEANLETNTEIGNSQMSIQKNIVLIAHESKKQELAELVAKHQEFFSKGLTISWPSVSEVLKQEAGLTVSEEIPSPTSGGYQKINVILGSGDVLAMIFIRDFLAPAPSPTNEETLLKICNINQVLVATNLKTAEAIVHYLKNITDS
ncbi:MAG: FHA domain-containing protein [Cuspidothrix sp.]